MKKIKLNLTIAFLVILSGYSHEIFAQEEFVIIVNKNVQQETINHNNLRRIYFEFITQWENSDTVRPAFAKVANNSFLNYISTNESRFKSFFTKRDFSDKAVTPLIFNDSKKLISYVASNTSAIGIIPALFKDDIGPDCKLMALE